MAMHVLARTGLALAGLGLGLLGLLGLPVHALSLGNLTVSSNASPSFTASLPFSDDKPVRLPELQTRLATDAEYAQWGLPMSPVVRELRVRVVHASQTVGTVELFSLKRLPQDHFDLLVWASYAGQTSLTHYKVHVLDLPSSVKGKTLSTSKAALPSTSQVSAQGKTPSTAPLLPPTASIKPSPEAETAGPASAPPSLNDQKMEASQAMPEAPSAAPGDSPVQASTQTLPTDQVPSDAAYSTASVLGGLALCVFVMGFFMGRLRQGSRKAIAASSPVHAVKAPSQTSPAAVMPSDSDGKTHAPALSPAPVASPAEASKSMENLLKAENIMASPNTLSMPAASDQWMPPPERAQVNTPSQRQAPGSSLTTPPRERLAAEAIENTAAQSLVEFTSAPAPDLASTNLLPRKPATALPTPKLAQGNSRARKMRKTKSAADSHIDLAKIYLSMGDPTTAQMVLQQVLAHGTEAERAQAEKLMQEMA